MPAAESSRSTAIRLRHHCSSAVKRASSVTRSWITAANRRTFAEVDRKLGAFPDGLCVDAEGHVWSNQVGIGRVVRYDPAGRIERQIQLPVPRAVGCTFGGDDLGTLFISSARETMTPQQLQNAPLSGSVFSVNPGVRGLPASHFKG